MVGSAGTRGDHAAAVAAFAAHATEAVETPLPVSVLRGATHPSASADGAALAAKAAEERAAEAAERARDDPGWDNLLGELGALDQLVLKVVDPEMAKSEEERAADAQARAKAFAEKIAKRAAGDEEESTDDDDDEAGGEGAGAELGSPAPPPADSGGSGAYTARSISNLANVAAAKKFGAGWQSTTSLTEQAQKQEIARNWERVLACKVHAVKGGVTIELTGRQVMGLHEAAARAPKKQVAFQQAGRTIVLDLSVVAALKRSVEEKCISAVAPTSYS